MIKPHYSNFRIIRAIVSGVRVVLIFIMFCDFVKFIFYYSTPTLMILSFRTDRSWQTVQTQNKLLLQ